MLRWTVHLQGGTDIDCHAAVAVGSKVYSFEGYCDRETYVYYMGHIDVHVFNTLSLRWMKLRPATRRGERLHEVPSMRWGHTAALIDVTIYVWGGVTDMGDYCNTLYAFDVDNHHWFRPRVAGVAPEARSDHSACVRGKVMYVYGGHNRRTGSNNDTHKLDTGAMVWSVINTRGAAIPTSERHSATLIGTKMLVFGGHNYNNNIRVFDTEAECWLSTPATYLLPEGRWGHSAFAYNGELYIFGGYNCHLERNFNDLWKFNPEAFSWKKVELKGKGPCWIYRPRCCVVGDSVVLFVGDAGTGHHWYVLDLSPSLKTLCKLAVIQYALEQSELPNDIRWELETMTTSTDRKNNGPLKKRKTKRKKRNG